MTTKRSSPFGSAVLEHLKERPEFSFFLYNDVWRIELTFTRNLKKYQMVFPFVSPILCVMYKLVSAHCDCYVVCQNRVIYSR